MINFLTKYYKLFILFLIPILFSSVFYYNKRIGSEEIPTTEILDEINYVQAGYTLRKTGIPTAWSNLDKYIELADKTNGPAVQFDDLKIKIDGKNPQLSKVRKYDYPVYVVSEQDRGIGKEQILYVQPFFDHPLLGGIIYSLGLKGNPTTFQDIQPQDYRNISLIVATISGVLITLSTYLLTKRLVPAIISLFIYSTAPTFVLSSRLALLENILIPFSLLFLILILLFKQTKKDFFLYLSGLAAGFSFLSKEQGIFVAIAGFIYLILNRYKFKQILKFIIPAALISSIHYLYGLYLSPSLVWGLFSDQAGRGFFGPLNIISSIRGLHFENFIIGGYFLFGIFALTLTARKFKQYQELIILANSYLFIFLFFGGLNYAWYYLPFIPFLVIASGIQLHKLLVKPNLRLLSLFFIFPFSSSMYWGYYVFKDHMNSGIYRLLLISFISIYLIYYFGQQIKNQKITLKFLPKRVNSLIVNLAHMKIHYYIWLIFISLTFYQLYKWNNQSIKYIAANWEKLPEKFLLSPY